MGKPRDKKTGKAKTRALEYECPSCSFYGNSVMEGNDRFISFLRDLRLQDELLKNPVVEEVAQSNEVAPAQTQLIMLD